MSEQSNDEPVAQMDGSGERIRQAMDELQKLTATVQSAAKASGESMASADAARVAALASQEAAKEAATAVAALKERVVTDQAVVATKSDHIQKAQEHADAVRANLDRTLTSATASATEAEALKVRAQAGSDSVEELLAEVRSTKLQIDLSGASIEKAKEDGEAATRALNSMAAIAKEAEARVAAYEKRLADLERQCNAQLQAITELLPGATSAGLAHAFDERRQTFLSPAERWQRWFIGSLVVLAILALSVLIPALWDSKPSTFEELGRGWLARLPFAAALVWLALHAAREAALAKRLEEDYGYKSAVAASFQGFNEQMQKITEKMTSADDDAKPDSPLAKLCSDTLATLASPPGRIYEKHALTMTPADKLQEMVEKILARKSQETS